jgi:hypothetical protein
VTALAIPKHRTHGLTAHQFAQLYRRLGFHIFPLLPESKKPAMKWGGTKLLPSTEPEFWRRRPDFGIAIALGPASSAFILDVDTAEAKGGAESLVKLSDRYGPPPRTPTVRTGSNGVHYYFAYPGFDVKNSASEVASGFDIKSRGGFAVAPSPSSHPRTGRQYTWLIAPWEAPVALAPAWLLNAVRPPPPRAPMVVDLERIRVARLQAGAGSPLDRALRYAEVTPPSIEGRGGRIALFTVAAVCVKALALDDTETLAVLHQYNLRAEPPWDNDDLPRFIREAHENSTIPLGAWL